MYKLPTPSRKNRATRAQGHQRLHAGMWVGVIVAVVGLGGFWFFSRKHAENPVPDAAPSPATTPSAPPVSQVRETIIPPETFDPLEYGGPVPDGYVLSPTLIRELYRMADDILKKAPPDQPTGLPEDLPTAVQEHMKALVREIRSSYPKMFCLKPELEAQMAEGKGDRQAEQRRYDEFYSLLGIRGVYTPQLVVEFQSEAKSGNATHPRLAVLVTVLGYQLLEAEKNSGRP